MRVGCVNVSCCQSRGDLPAPDRALSIILLALGGGGIEILTRGFDPPESRKRAVSL